MQLEELFTLTPGASHVLVNVPHAGTRVPDDLMSRFQPAAAGLVDTDWYVDELYSFAPEMGAGLMAATHSRYVVDLNRPSDNQSLYSTRTTGLVPLENFDGTPVYADTDRPGDAEIRQRVDRYWRPYHAALERELHRIRDLHGYAILLDAHSIRGRLPRLFEGQLPDLNLGSFKGSSAESTLVADAMQVLGSAEQWSVVLDGRFQGGHITRHYGRPDQCMHALQLEMAQSVYMNEIPAQADTAGMHAARDLLRRLLAALLAWKPADAS